MRVTISINDVLCYRGKEDYDAEIVFDVDETYYSHPKSASIGSGKVIQVVIGTHMTQQRATELAATKKQELLNALVDTAEAFLKPFPPAKE